MIRYFLPLLLLPLVAVAEKVTLFSAAALEEWEYQTFNDIKQTDYRVEFDDTLNRPVLVANSRGGASGYTLQRDINLRETPWLHFLWRVDETAANDAEKEKSGDDYVWRIYFVGRSGIQYRSLNFVLSQTAAVGDIWKSPYAGFMRNLHIQALATDSDAAPGVWHTSRINVADAWQQVFEKEAAIGLVGLMTDGDSSGVTMRARYGEIILSDSPDSPFAGLTATSD